MPRPLRIEFDGACYHVMCRGNRKGEIFRGDEDRTLFLKTLGEACGKTGWRIHAWVLMPNHYHLLVETPKGNLVAGMRWMQSTYTTRFNVRHRLAGHLFQGRYKSLLVDAESKGYLTTVARYIHLNPVRARLVEAAGLPAYPWSSVCWYLATDARPGWFSADRVLGEMGLPDDTDGCKHYVQGLVDEGTRVLDPATGSDPFERIRRGWFFGEDDRKKAILERVGKDGGSRESHSGAAAEAHQEARARRLVDLELGRIGLTLDEVSRMAWTDKRKRQIAGVVRRQTTVSNRWVAELLGGGHESTVSRAVHEQE